MSALKRRRRTPHPKQRRLRIDIGPFLNIVVCVIGVIVLLLSGLVAAGSLIDPRAAERDGMRASLVVVAEIVKLRAQLSDLEKRSQDLDSQLKDADTVLAAKKKQFNDLKALKQQHEAAKAQLASLEKIFNSPEFQEKLKRLLAVQDLEGKLGVLRDKAASLLEQIKLAEAEAKETENTVSVPLLPMTAGAGAERPVFVECHARGATIFQQTDDGVSEVFVERSKIATHPQILKLIKEADASSGTGRVIVINLLLRPGGVKSWNVITNTMSDSKNVPFVTTPITVTGRIQFQKSKK